MQFFFSFVPENIGLDMRSVVLVDFAFSRDIDMLAVMLAYPVAIQLVNLVLVAFFCCHILLSGRELVEPSDSLAHCCIVL